MPRQGQEKVVKRSCLLKVSGITGLPERSSDFQPKLRNEDSRFYFGGDVFREL